MEIDGFSSKRFLFEENLQSQKPPSFKDELDEELFYQLVKNLPTTSITTNNSFILKRMNIIFSQMQQSLLREDIDLKSIHVFGSQSTGLALKTSDIDLTILAQEKKVNSIAPKLYAAFQKIPQSKFLKLGFHQKFSFNMIYHPVMQKHLIQISNIQTTKLPNHYQSIDLMINEYDGVRNSMAVRHLVQVSKTYRYLVLTLKLWLAQFSRKQRLPLYSYYIMAAHYLQHIVYPALLPPVDLRQFREESFTNLIETSSQMASFDHMDLIDKEGFSGLSNLLRGFFSYYGLEYLSEKKRPTIFVQQSFPTPDPFAKKMQPISTFHIVDPLSHKPIVDLKVFENRTRLHVSDMEKAFLGLSMNHNILYKGTSSQKLSPSAYEKIKQKEQDILKKFIEDRERGFKLKTTAFQTHVKDNVDEFKLKEEQTTQKQKNKKKRITYRIDPILEKRLLFQKQIHEKQGVQSNNDSNSSSRKSLSEIQYLLRRRNANTKIYRHGVQAIFKILNILPK